MTRQEHLVTVAVILVGGLLLAVQLEVLWLPRWLQVGLALGFFAYGPGHGWVKTLRLGEPWLEIALTVAVSLALTLGVAMAMVNLELWTVPGGLATLLLISTLGAAARRWRADATGAGPAGAGP